MHKFRRSKNGASIAFLAASNGLFASPLSYPASYTPKDLLVNLLSGEWDAKYSAVKWNATPCDLYGFNWELSEQLIIYPVIDTTFVICCGVEKLYYVVFSSAPMLTNEEGEFANANSCHVRDLNLGDGYELLKVDDPYEGIGTPPFLQFHN